MLQGYVGFFCLISGISLGVNLDIRQVGAAWVNWCSLG
jgi:hypothetical protein